MSLEMAKFGEVFAETCQGARNAVKRGDITVEQAQAMCSKTYLELGMQQLASPWILFESGSTQLGELMKTTEKLS
jgi:hypothetical protein